MKSRHSRIYAYMALGGATLAVVFHVCSFLGLSLPPGAMILHLGIFLLVIPAAKKALSSKHIGLRDLLRRIPRLSTVILIVAAFYAPAQFGYRSLKLGAAFPEERDGRYQLVSRGSVVQELSADEYAYANALDARMWSAYWFCAYWCLFVYFQWTEAALEFMERIPPHTGSRAE